MRCKAEVEMLNEKWRLGTKELINVMRYEDGYEDDINVMRYEDEYEDEYDG